jgi:hypothetical protein
MKTSETIHVLRDRNPLAILVIILSICAIALFIYLIKYMGLVMLIPIVILTIIILAIRFRSFIVFKDRIEIVRKGLFPGLIAIEQIYFKDIDAIEFVKGKTENSTFFIFRSRRYKAPDRIQITLKTITQREIYSFNEKALEICFTRVKDQFEIFQMNSHIS